MSPPSIEKDKATLRDMISWANKAIGYLGTSSLENFLDDALVQDACARCIEVFGEAAGLVSEECRQQHPTFPWRKAKGMRNMLIHQYGSVDHGIVFETVSVFFPELITQLQSIVGDYPG